LFSLQLQLYQIFGILAFSHPLVSHIIVQPTVFGQLFGQPRFKRKKAHHQIETIRIWLKFVDYRRICTYGHRQFAQKEGETTLYIEVF